MVIKTKFFGEIEINDSDVICFDEGIPGFLDLHKFIVFNDDENIAISYLQSIEEERVCFITITPAFVDNSYEIELGENTVAKLKIEKPEDVNVYAILTLSESFKDTTANLKAPIIVNTRNKRALQEILDDERYSIRHRIVKESDV